jgi:hypothetical protein
VRVVPILLPPSLGSTKNNQHFAGQSFSTRFVECTLLHICLILPHMEPELGALYWANISIPTPTLLGSGPLYKPWDCTHIKASPHRKYFHPSAAGNLSVIFCCCSSIPILAGCARASYFPTPQCFLPYSWVVRSFTFCGEPYPYT